MPKPMPTGANPHFWLLLQHMLTIMYFALLVILFPGVLYVTSSGELDVLNVIPNGYQIWQISYYVVPAITFVLIVALFLHRRAERRRPARELQQVQSEVLKSLRQQEKP